MTGRALKGLKLLVFFAVLALASRAHAAGEETLRLCVDNRYWYPFTFEENSLARGMHVDIVAKALENLGRSARIVPLPRKRCIRQVENGSADGMISEAYSKEFAGALDFPDGSEMEGESPWRIMQVDLMVVTSMDDPYEFEGDIRTLPLPVRVPAGENVIEIFGESELYVEEAKTDEQNFGKLERDKRGVVITTSVMAETMGKDSKFKGGFNIHPTPLLSQSYHLVFHPGGKVSPEERQKIWDEIRKLRDDYVFMLQLFARY